MLLPCGKEAVTGEVHVLTLCANIPLNGALLRLCVVGGTCTLDVPRSLSHVYAAFGGDDASSRIVG